MSFYPLSSQDIFLSPPSYPVTASSQAPKTTLPLFFLPGPTPTILRILPLLTSTHPQQGWSTPQNCPALNLLPHYQVCRLARDLYALRGIHIRYHAGKQRAFLNLPLHQGKIPGTPFRLRQPLTALLHNSATNTLIDAGTHNLLPANRSSGRCHLTLNQTATNHLKIRYQLHTHRLIDNPHITALLIPQTQTPTTQGPPNLWKPLALTAIYQHHGLLQQTIHHLGYTKIISADLHLHGGGPCRPDIIIIAAKPHLDGATTHHKILIEAKACHQRMAKRYTLEAIIQLLYHKLANEDHKDTEIAIVSIPCEAIKPKWDTVIEAIRNAEEIKYNRNIRKMANQLRRLLSHQTNELQFWYEEKLCLHDYNLIHLLASRCPPYDQKIIEEILNKIRWT